MFRCVWRPLEDVLAACVVFCYESAGQDGVNGGDCQLNSNVETHEQVNSLIEARLLELVLALVHDQLAIVAGVHHETRCFLTVAQSSSSVHELFEVDVGLFVAKSDVGVEIVQVCDRAVAFDCQQGTVGREESTVDATQRQLGLQIGFTVERGGLVESFTPGILSR